MDSLHHRLFKSFEYLKDNGIIHTQTQFAEAIGKPRPNVTKAFLGEEKRCTLGLMKAIYAAFPDVFNEEYLLTGVGELAKPSKDMRPHFKAKAAAGFMDGFAEGEYAPEMRPFVANAPDYDFSIDVHGDSMESEIHDSDTLLCRRVDDRLNIPYGKICVIDSKEGAAVKVLKECKHGVICHSLNDKYNDYELLSDDILGLAKVVGLIRNYD